MNIKHIKGKLRRNLRTRQKIKNTARTRLSVFRSNQRFYAQLIDAKGKTILSVDEKELSKTPSKLTKSQRAKLLGQLLAQKAKKAKVTQVVFDRGSYKYHGRVKIFAESARENGLKF